VVPLVAPVESNGPHRHLRVTPSNSIHDERAVSERSAQRSALRRLRADLTPQRRATAARTITSYIGRTRWLHAGRPIALYVSVGSEVDTGPVLEAARLRRCRVYLPRITDYRAHRMQFVLRSSATTVSNRHGIPEPVGREHIAPRALSVIFMPVLGFDARGTRLGSGAGYYDRMFSFRRHLQWHRPLLVGIAYRCQELTYIQPLHHDVPLDAVVTEDGVRYFRHGG
jgi:5-formyltetrahydrofolate cyclo-ligase